MSAPRKPAAFRTKTNDKDPSTAELRQREPRALDADSVIVTPAEVDVFDLPAEDLPPPLATKRRSWPGTIFFAAAGALLSLAFGLWADQLVRDLFMRSNWLGWFAAVLSVLAGLSLIVILVREVVAIARLASVERLRDSALDAISHDDSRTAQKVISDLSRLLESKPETAAGRRSLADLQGDIIDGADLVRLAETELLAPLDIRARKLILDAAKRVSLVTAVSPRALVDLAYVLFESGRLIRRLSELYGGRPGALGFVRLSKGVLAHLAVTGAVAAGDDFVHQVVGQGLAARLSARLGEGVVNGMMTVRIGIAAVEVIRPLPFTALKRPGLSDFLAQLATFSRRKEGKGRD